MRTKPVQSMFVRLLSGLAIILATIASFGIEAANADESQSKNNDKEKPACALKRLASIDMVGPQGNWVPVTIGSTKALMVLHTSSATGFIFESAMQPLALQRKSLNSKAAVKAGDVTLTDIAKVEGLQIGNARYGKAEFLVYPNKGIMGTYEGMPIIGALGLDLFSNIDFELDLSHRRINLFSQDHCPGEVVYWTDNYAAAPLFKGRLGEIYFPMELDGKKIEATFDPQRPISALSTDVTKRLYDFDQTSTGNEVVRLPNGDAQYFYRAMTITGPGLSISNSRIQLTDPKKNCDVTKRTATSKAAGFENCYGSYPLVLGRGVLDQLRVYFAMKEKMIYYSSADATR